jgi:very-short-patch-repair endonuclease
MTDKTKEFIKKAISVHGDKYDYSKVEYKKAIEKIIIICKDHGEFLQTPNTHLGKSGCSNCVDRTKRRSDIEDFIKKARQVHEDKYDYSKFKYINCKTKGIIICREHGDFEQQPNNHLQGKKCSKCSSVYKPNTQEFIENALKIHGNKYDYSKVEYKKAIEKVIIICKEHGEFEQQPSNHLQGNGCNKCVDRGGTQRYDNECFIEKAVKKHGDKYDYSKVLYKNSLSKVIIICKVHGEFEQVPSSHLQGSGCLICSGAYKKTSEEFIKVSKKLHGDIYDYSKVEYIGCKIKVKIICKKHGEFEQTPDSHVQGCGCNKCAIVIRQEDRLSNNEEFIEKSKIIHGEKYDYSKIEYINSVTNVVITCIKHGDFYQTPNSHLCGYGCKKCGVIQSSNIRKYNNDEFIEKSKIIHGEKYDYSKVDYFGYKIKVIIICKKHGEFLQSPGEHWAGCGCPLCVNKTETKLYERLKPIYPSIIIQFKQEWCKKISYLPFDFCIPELKIIIELDGIQHFKQVSNWTSPEEQFENDIYKEKCANENGYSVIRLLQEDVFNDSYDWNMELCKAIENIKNNNKTKNIYLCKNDEYKNFKNEKIQTVERKCNDEIIKLIKSEINIEL